MAKPNKYWLTILSLICTITLSVPKSASTSTSQPFFSPSPQEFRSTSYQIKTRKETSFHYRYRILSSLFDSLYEVYLSIKSAKEYCDALEAKYRIDDAGLNGSSYLSFISMP